MKFIFCHTISGEGYSNPTFVKCNTRGEALIKLKDKLNSFDLKKSVLKELSKDDISIETNDDFDRLRIISVKDSEAYLIEHTEPNEVEVLPFESSNAAQNEMIARIGLRPLQSGEEQYEGGDEYGAHFEDGYIHWAIV